jgi:hypothetical protein
MVTQQQQTQAANFWQSEYGKIYEKSDEVRRLRQSQINRFEVE